MKNRITAALMLGLILPWTGNSYSQVSEDIALSDTVNQKNFVTPTPEQVSALESMFAGWLNPESSQRGGAADRSLALGFDVQTNDAGTAFLADNKNRGWGYYRFRSAPANSLVIQAPHQFFDRHTGAIARSLFEQAEVKALALNSTHRYSDRREGTAPSDLSHIPFSPFNALTRAIALSMPDAHIVQLHGYSADKRKTSAARNSDIIISSGPSAPQPRMLELADCLEASTPWQVKRFPGQVSELGGTRNFQGRLVHALGMPIFTHLELSRDVRDSLISDPQTLSRFARCFGDSGKKP
ncbi:MAG: hypothetical protein EP339_14310 [Gammaproteobacteria bacterium]|nr:MAG: hypothetical protein EP339_14310 [Gammaproteobacteria bacterium]